MHSQYRPLVFATSAVLLLALFTYTANYFVYEYPGNNYLPPEYGVVIIILLLFYIGCRIQFRNNNRITQIAVQLIGFYGVISCIAFCTNGIQYTPFALIDPLLIDIELFFGFDLVHLMDWLQTYPLFKFILAVCYDSLAYQIAFLPIVIILFSTKKSPNYKQRLYRFYLLALWSVFWGFSIYYFFPTTAPAAHLKSPWFMQSQYATGLKFYQLHHYIQPVTMDGGMIAFPSFHSIWALLCLYLIWPWRLAFLLLLLVNSALLLGCVLLGWHYPIDVFASFALLAFCYWLILCHEKSLKLQPQPHCGP